MTVVLASIKITHVDFSNWFSNILHTKNGCKNMYICTFNVFCFTMGKEFSLHLYPKYWVDTFLFLPLKQMYPALDLCKSVYVSRVRRYLQGIYECHKTMNLWLFLENQPGFSLMKYLSLRLQTLHHAIAISVSNFSL